MRRYSANFSSKHRRSADPLETCAAVGKLGSNSGSADNSMVPAKGPKWYLGYLGLILVANVTSCDPLPFVVVHHASEKIAS